MNWIKKGLELAEKATPGPWIHSADGWLKAIYTNGGLTRFSGVFTQHRPSVRNVEFAIDARTNYPRALNWISRVKPILEADLEGLSSEVRPDDSEVYPEECKELRELLSELEGE